MKARCVRAVRAVRVLAPPSPTDDQSPPRLLPPRRKRGRELKNTRACVRVCVRACVRASCVLRMMWRCRCRQIIDRRTSRLRPTHLQYTFSWFCDRHASPSPFLFWAKLSHNQIFHFPSYGTGYEIKIVYCISNLTSHLVLGLRQRPCESGGLAKQSRDLLTRRATRTTKLCVHVRACVAHAPFFFPHKDAIRFARRGNHLRDLPLRLT